MIDIIVYSKYYCPFCDKAKQLLKSKDLSFVEKDVADINIKKELLNIVPHAKTVPQIFIDGKHIGGYTELELYFKE